MSINRDIFFREVRRRPFRGSLSSEQVAGMNAILAEWESRGLTDIRWLAYMLATTKWETDHTMQPIAERGGSAYFRRMYDIEGDRPALARKNGNTQPGDGMRYRGRGYVQLTWRNNYRRMAKLVGLPLEDKPDLAMRQDVASKVLFEGMIGGLFTGKKLANYFSGRVDDPYNARRIINGTDQASQISAIHSDFLRALAAADGVDDTRPARREVERPARDVEESESHVAREVVDEVEPPHGERSDRIYNLQCALRDFGYYEVGEADSKWGGMTAAAIAAYKNDRHLPGPAVPDKALEEDIGRAKLDGFKRPVSDDRKNADAGRVSEVTEAVPATQTNKTIAASGGILATLVAMFNGVASYFSDLWDSSAVVAVREFAHDNMTAIFIGVAVAAFFMWRQSNRAESSIIDAFRKGKLR